MLYSRETKWFNFCEKTRNLQKRYGLNCLEHNWLYFLQEGICANEGCSNEAIAVDHDHSTGKIRELLCHHCNTAFGALDESYERLVGLICYKTNHLNETID